MPKTPIQVQQMDDGGFEVRKTDISSGNTHVAGWLYVEQGIGMKIEHWVFIRSYTSPTGDKQLEVQRLPTGWSSLSAFMAAMRAQEPENAPYKYWRCECVYHDRLPTS